MAVGDITNIGTPSAGSAGTTQAITVATAPTAPTQAGIYVAISLRDVGNTANPACADSRSNVYTRIKIENSSGVTEGCVFYSAGATPLVNGDSITISGLTASSSRIMAAGYVERMGTVFGSASAAQLTGTGDTAASGNIASMPTGTIAIGYVGWSNQSPQDTFITIATPDADYAADLTGGATSEGSGNGIDRAIYIGNRVISSLTTDGFTNVFNTACVWNSILVAFNPVAPTTVEVGIATETDSAFGLVLDGQIIAVGLATETDSALAAAPVKTITIRDDFERSSINTSGSSVDYSDPTKPVVSLKPRVQESEIVSSETRWLYPYARIDGVDGVRPEFILLDYGTPATAGKYHGTSWPAGRRMMFSYDQENWVHFDTNHTVGSTTVTFRHSAAFTEGTVYLAWARALSVTQIGQKIEDLATAFPSLIDTVPSTLGSGNVPAEIQSFPAQDFISDMFAAQTDELTRTIDETPFYGFKISDSSLNPTDGSAKRTFVFTFGVHAGEDQGDHVGFHAIEFLCGASAAAQNVRRHADIFVYGPVNGPGRNGGGWRGSYTNGPAGIDDANRNFIGVAADTGLDIVDTPMAAMVNDLPDVVQLSLDFHGAWSTRFGVFAPDAVRATIIAALDLYAPSAITDLGAGSAGTVKSWFEANYDTGLNITSETGEPTPINDADLLDWGQAHIEAISDLIDDAVVPKFATVGIASETDSALTITPSVVGGQTVQMGLAVETDFAFAMIISGGRNHLPRLAL